MKDNFLKAYRKEPPAELVEDVYRRIEMVNENKSLQPQTVRQRWTWREGLRPLAVAGLAAMLLLLLYSPLIPTARALMEDVVHRIGGLTLLETDLYPDSSDANLEPSEYVTLAEARELLSFTFTLPTVVPERYTMVEEVHVIPGFKSATIYWTNENERGDGFSLSVSPAEPDVNWLVGPDSIEVVTINGREGQFVIGGWDSNQETWNPDIARMLRWEQDGIEYQIGASGAFTCPDREDYHCPLTREVMIEIAASVPPLPAAAE